MALFGLFNKIDLNLKPYINISSRNKIPVIVSYKGSSKKVKQKILSFGGRIKYEYTAVNAIAVSLRGSGIDKLSEMPEITSLTLDYKAMVCMTNSEKILGVHHARNFNLTGKGIGIGIVDTGVYPHPDILKKRDPIGLFTDLVSQYLKPYDDNGHGTFISGCLVSCGAYTGICPDAVICMVKAFDAAGNGFMSDIIRGIEILLNNREKYNIRIILLPFEIPNIIKVKSNPLEEIIVYAVKSGISVIAPSGNLGPQPMSINCPGNISEVITVAGINCSEKPFDIAAFSGRGPLINGTAKPDVCAPCVNVTSLSCNKSYLPFKKNFSHTEALYTSMSGTSIAAAFIAGAAALILEKTPELTPSDLKSIILLSTRSLGENKYSQGSGQFIFEKILK